MLNNQNKFISLAYRGKNDGVVFDKFDVDEVSIVSLKKHVFSSRLLNLILVYGKQSMQMQKNYLDVAIFTNNTAIYKSVIDLHVSGSLIDHVFIMSTLLVEFFINDIFENFFIGPWCCKNCKLGKHVRFSHDSIKYNMVRQERTTLFRNLLRN